jgi:hypothetical protein
VLKALSALSTECYKHKGAYSVFVKNSILVNTDKTKYIIFHKMAKYRKNKIKQQHTILEGFRKFLEELSENQLVQSIIPGRISTKGSKSSSGERIVELQYETKTGLKILLKHGTAVQEVFVITNNPQELISLVFKEKRIQL